MNKFIFIVIIISLLLVPGIWYNLIRDNPISAQEAPEGEGVTERERIFTPEEVVVCILEVPIGEAIEEAMDFACRLSKALANLQLAVHEYPRVVREIADLAKSCRSDFCSPICVDDTELVCVDVTEEVCEEVCEKVCNTVERCRDSLLECENDRPAWALTDCEANLKEVICPVPGHPGPCLEIWEWCWEEEICDIFCWEKCEEITEEVCDVVPVCRAQPCSGDPCPARPLIEEKFNQLANLSRTIERERSIINNLLNVKRPEIKKKLDEARRLFEKNAPTVELYEFLRGPTPCVIAIDNYWVELQDVQDKKVCKSLYNYLICR